jgi:putative tricarboxylic transport membrane protein
MSLSSGQGGARHRPDWPVVVIGLALLAVAAVVGWEAHRVSSHAVTYGLGPTAFPAAVAVLLAVLGAATVVAGWRGTFPEREHDEAGPVLWIVAGLVAQMLLISYTGFSIATGILFAATARGMGRGPLWLTVPVGVVLSLIVWTIFAKLLRLNLPAGPLEHLIP